MFERKEGEKGKGKGRGHCSRRPSFHPSGKNGCDCNESSLKNGRFVDEVIGGKREGKRREGGKIDSEI